MMKHTVTCDRCKVTMEVERGGYCHEKQPQIFGVSLRLNTSKYESKDSFCSTGTAWDLCLPCEAIVKRAALDAAEHTVRSMV